MSAEKKDAPQGALCTLVDSLSVEELSKTVKHHILSQQGRDPERANPRDFYKAVSYALRDVLVEKWINTQQSYYAKERKRVYYLSLEFLVGRSLGNSLINLGFYDKVSQVLERLGYDLEEIREEEEDAALGNGGLGRLAACFLDSFATLGIPGYGYGIRYEYGMFYQRLVDGQQMEYPDNWLRYGTPWEFERPEYLYPVRFYGRLRHTTDDQGRFRSEWVDADEVMAMACDLLIPGYRNDNVINLRLWTAKASRELDLTFFNRGDYIAAVKSKVRSETISKLLYPTDDIREGQELRLRQQYFFVAATFQDIFRRYKKKETDFGHFSDKIAVHLNDTHPAIAIPELMRLLVDEEGVPWEQAWEITVNTFAYTNHTLMPEALETWPVEILGRVLPRHLEIIYEINHRFLAEVRRRYPGDDDRARVMSLIEEGPVKKVRMAHLAIVGSHSVNGVARLHTHLLRSRIFPAFDAYYPGRFNSKTNGITPRRWLLKCNPGLAELITATIGAGWEIDLDRLRALEKHANKAAFRKRWAEVKHANKVRLARLIAEECGVEVDPESMFDVQVKRIHEYKRQLLNILQVIVRYHRLLADPDRVTVPRTVIFGGKAAPSYWKAKLIIRLINAVARVINNDQRVGDRLKVAFIPNYGVSLAEKIIPAADLSEQISTAGTEASGTGNMKFALNGALTIGTLDGANIEIRDEVGQENIFIFGLTAEKVEWQRRAPSRMPVEICDANPEIGLAVESLKDGSFADGDAELFRPLADSLLDTGDPFLTLVDLEDYLRCQEEVDALYLDRKAWVTKSILNVARMGRFSTDRTVREYAREIWGIKRI